MVSEKQLVITLIFIIAVMSVYNLLITSGANPIAAFASGMTFALVILTLLGFAAGIRLLKILR